MKNLIKKLRISANTVGGRIHVVNLEVDYTRTHREAVLSGGPQTEKNHHIFYVGNEYHNRSSHQKGMMKTVVILFNFSNSEKGFKEAIDWGISNGLLKTTPHVVFAMGEKRSKLNYILGPNPMRVIETTGCDFEGNPCACYLRWNDAIRMSDVGYQGAFGHNYDWLAFLVPKNLQTGRKK
jgi:hypothetical protein